MKTRDFSLVSHIRKLSHIFKRVKLSEFSHNVYIIEKFRKLLHFCINKKNCLNFKKIYIFSTFSLKMVLRQLSRNVLGQNG